MKKLLAILVLGLFLTSCTQQNRSDEYLCKFISGKRQQDDVTLEILKNQVILQYLSGSKFEYSILEEKSDRFFLELSLEDFSKQIFYKKTKKYFDSGKKQKTFLDYLPMPKVKLI